MFVPSFWIPVVCVYTCVHIYVYAGVYMCDSVWGGQRLDVNLGRSFSEPYFVRQGL